MATRKPTPISGRSRKPKNEVPAEPAPEPVLCAEPDCGARITELDAEGWGVCANGHLGQPVPGTFRPETPAPADEPQEPSATHQEFVDEHGDHPCTCQHIGYGHYEGGPCSFVDGNELHCSCEGFDCALPKSNGKAEQTTFVQETPELHRGRPVIERRAAISGTVPIDKYRPEYRSWWDGLFIGAKGSIHIGYEVMGDGYVPVVDKGVIMGLADTRKIKINGVIMRTSMDETEGLPLWEQERATQTAALFQMAGNLADVLSGVLSDSGKLEAAAAITVDMQNLLSKGSAAAGPQNDLASSLAEAINEEEDSDG